MLGPLLGQAYGTEWILTAFLPGICAGPFISCSFHSLHGFCFSFSDAGSLSRRGFLSSHQEQALLQPRCAIRGSSNAEPATEYGSACSEFSKGQKQEGQEQGKGHSDQSYIGPQRDNKCQSSEDGPASQEVAKRCPE